MSLRAGKLPSLGSEDEFFDHKGNASFTVSGDKIGGPLCLGGPH